MGHLPSSFIHTLQGLPGFDEQAFLDAHQVTSLPISIRQNPHKNIGKNCFENTSSIPWCADGRYLPQRPSFILDPLWHAGAYYVQEASSMFLDYVVKHLFENNLKEKKVLDLCAAPGGKSTLLSALFTDGLVVSNEVIKSRVSILYENIVKWGLPNTIITHNDAAAFQRLPGFFDLMVIDAPCSGSGLFRRQPEAGNKWSEQQVIHCSMRQKKILADAIPALQDDGVLIYSTCSFSYEENEAIADWLCKEYALESLSIPIKNEWGITVSYSKEKQASCYRFYPDKAMGEGFFMAIFRKCSGNFLHQGNNISAGQHLYALKDRSPLEQYIDASFDGAIFLQADTIRAINHFGFEQLDTIKQNLYITHAGISCGSLKQKDFIPHHGLAVSTIINKNLSVYAADEAVALQYLRKQDIPNISAKGWLPVQYKDCNIGWIKVLPNRINNYYPTEWRILKT